MQDMSNHVWRYFIIFVWRRTFTTTDVRRDGWVVIKVGFCQLGETYKHGICIQYIQDTISRIFGILAHDSSQWHDVYTTIYNLTYMKKHFIETSNKSTFFWIPPRSRFFAYKSKNIKRFLTSNIYLLDTFLQKFGKFHFYFSKLCSKCWDVSKFSGKTPFKKTQLKLW